MDGQLSRTPLPGYDYKYYGWYGPRYEKKHYLAGAVVTLLIIPILLFGIALLITLGFLLLAAPALAAMVAD